MSTVLAAPPLQTPIIESAKEPFITKVWGLWLRALVDRAQLAAYAVIAIARQSQTASIGATSLIPLAAGRYRVSYRVRVRTAAGVSSSIQVTVNTTEGGIACTQSSTAYTGNAVNAPQSGSFIVNADPATPLQYVTTYASNPAAAMAYDLDVIAEAL